MELGFPLAHCVCTVVRSIVNLGQDGIFMRGFKIIASCTICCSHTALSFLFYTTALLKGDGDGKTIGERKKRKKKRKDVCV